jgi:hypothetical protein
MKDLYNTIYKFIELKDRSITLCSQNDLNKLSEIEQSLIKKTIKSCNLKFIIKNNFVYLNKKFFTSAKNNDTIDIIIGNGQNDIIQLQKNTRIYFKNSLPILKKSLIYWNKQGLITVFPDKVAPILKPTETEEMYQEIKHYLKNLVLIDHESFDILVTSSKYYVDYYRRKTIITTDNEYGYPDYTITMTGIFDRYGKIIKEFNIEPDSCQFLNTHLNVEYPLIIKDYENIAFYSKESEDNLLLNNYLFKNQNNRVFIKISDFTYNHDIKNNNFLSFTEATYIPFTINDYFNNYNPVNCIVTIKHAIQNKFKLTNIDTNILLNYLYSSAHNIFNESLFFNELEKAILVNNKQDTFNIKLIKEFIINSRFIRYSINFGNTFISKNDYFKNEFETELFLQYQLLHTNQESETSLTILIESLDKNIESNPMSENLFRTIRKSFKSNFFLNIIQTNSDKDQSFQKIINFRNNQTIQEKIWQENSKIQNIYYSADFIYEIKTTNMKNQYEIKSNNPNSKPFFIKINK